MFWQSFLTAIFNHFSQNIYFRKIELFFVLRVKLFLFFVLQLQALLLKVLSLLSKNFTTRLVIEIVCFLVVFNFPKGFIVVNIEVRRKQLSKILVINTAAKYEVL